MEQNNNFQIEYTVQANKNEQYKLNNYLTILENFISTHYEIRNNIVSNNIEIKDKNGVNNEFKNLNEFDLLRFLRKNNFKIKINAIVECLKSDFTSKFNPFKDYFDNLKKWDNIDHIKNLCSYIKLKEDERELFEFHFKKSLKRTIACALEIAFNKQCFILVGDGRQNIGKSTFIRYLCPPALKEYYTEDLSLDKDGVISLAENFIINIDELAMYQKIELNRLKSFMSKDIIKVRQPYDRRPTIAKRRASFFATTNETKFLTDLTGNVRYVCFKIFSIDFNYSKNINIDDIWAQVYNEYLKDNNGQLTLKELKDNELHNETFIQMPAEVELISKYILPAEQNSINAVFMTTTDIVKFLDSKMAGAVKFNVNGVGRALKRLNFIVSDKKSDNNYYQIKGYYCQLI